MSRVSLHRLPIIQFGIWLVSRIVVEISAWGDRFHHSRALTCTYYAITFSLIRPELAES